MTTPLAAACVPAAALLAPAAACGQGPFGPPPGPYLAPAPHFAPDFAAPPALTTPLGPSPFGPPGFGTPGFGPPAPRFAAPALPPRDPPVLPRPTQSTLFQPHPLAPPVRLEPVAEEVTVGRVTARRYDYSFEAVPPTPAAGPPVW